jgi:hypothetical protein
MRRRSLILPILAALLSSTSLLAQNPADALHAPDGNMHEMIQSIFITAVPNAPFQLVLRADIVKHLPDGSTTTRWNQRLIVRDSRGRIYQERRTLVAEGSDHQPGIFRIEISDPAAHTKYFCDAELKNCELRTYNAPPLEPPMPAGPIGDSGRYLSRASLGAKTIDGVEVTGTRETVTVGQGAAGNTAPIDFTKEIWYSSTLGLNLEVTRLDPLHGDQFFKVTSLKLDEPDARLFTIPANCKVTDQRQNVPPAGTPVASR